MINYRQVTRDFCSKEATSTLLVYCKEHRAFNPITLDEVAHDSRGIVRNALNNNAAYALKRLKMQDMYTNRLALHNRHVEGPGDLRAVEAGIRPPSRQGRPIASLYITNVFLGGLIVTDSGLFAAKISLCS